MARYKIAACREINFFLPMFLSKAARIELTKLLPPYYQNRMRLYFSRFGCLRCGRRDAAHYAHGMCGSCDALIGGRLKMLDRKYGALYKERESEAARHLIKRLTSAKELLRDLKGIL